MKNPTAPILLIVLCPLLLLGSCQKPAADPDQELRDTIVGLAWLPDTDPAYTDVVTPSIVFFVGSNGGGRALIDQQDGTWNYSGSVFTISGPLGSYTTASPKFSAHQFWFNYGPTTTSPQLVHLRR